MSIDSVVFPLTARTVGGSTGWQTSIQQGTSGRAARNADWQDSLRRFDAGRGIQTLQDQMIAETFHMACQGRAYGFLLTDWKDYQCTETLKTLAAGITQRGVATALGSNQYQLAKNYSHGARTTSRRITRPKSGTLLVFDSSLVQITSGYSVDYTTGIVTSTTPVAFHRCDFYVPCYFENDRIDWSITLYRLTTGTGYGDAPEVPIVEARE